MKKIALSIIFSAIFFLGVAEDVRAAITPVARFDVVPYQRIKHGGSFKIGVVAFSKPGIQKVEFSANGQGYSGGTKTVTAMSLNDQTDVWEYWTTFASNEFTGNGAVTINAMVTDNDGNHRDLALSMIVEGASAFFPVTAWVSPTGNNTTCVVNNENSPCQTMAGAIAKIQVANGGNSNGAIIYLQEGTYSVAGVSASTTNEWLTITKDEGANKNNVSINSGQLTTGYLKFENVTLKSLGSGLYVADDSSTRLWTNNCRRIGSGYDIVNSNPVHLSDGNNHYSTGDYTVDSDYGYRKAAIVRGADMVDIGVDIFQNTPLVINSKISGQTNSSGLHADAYQVHTTGEPPAENRIIYNFRATDLHYQGIFMRSDAGTAKDNAFINVFVEMREPAMKNESDLYSFASFSAYHNWDHLIVWNSDFLVGHSEVYGTLTNSSFVGNIFRTYIDDSTAIGTSSLPYASFENSENNEFLHNHFYQVRGETLVCEQTTRDIASSWPCPHWYAKKPDSGASATATVGEGVIDLNPSSQKFTYPVQDSILIGRFAPKVPIDIYNRERGASSDVGAVEYAVSSNPPATTCSDGIQNQDETGIDCGGVCQTCVVVPPLPTCNDGIQNQRETGIDCGGPCSACAVLPVPTCNDDIQNQDETGIDCGGSCASCAVPPTPSYQCSDGLDNDSDGLIDFLIDPGCTSANDNDEYNAPQVVVPPSDGNNDDNKSSSKSSDKKKETVKKRSISVSKKSLTRGQTLIERGKNFSKKSPVLLYFSKTGGGYHPPKRMITDSKGKFSLSYKIPTNKPKGTYSWYAVDEKTGKKSKVVRFVVR